MKTVNASAILALYILGSCLVSASLEVRQVPVANYRLTGYSRTPGTPYPYYNISVLEDGVTNPISASSPPALFSIPSTSLKVPSIREEKLPLSIHFDALASSKLIFSAQRIH